MHLALMIASPVTSRDVTGDASQVNDRGWRSIRIASLSGMNCGQALMKCDST
jgi:hypothetical protein